VESFSTEKELVLTGSIPESWMIEKADYVTDMEKIKHPFDKGINAREGVEY
jgi:cob(I)alamin adenosyltransferase